ncbi:phosphoribosylamine--glycine ligase [Cyclonatronum proteinivorum]|uniref:Phosphoribosylamine--glycine ligase n=1 Tax=Cyclonatronum proteinivorum TaxID=1457365 RepID=A0A345ULK6_9BACT|nr:phosphoribosylamine--glycine ligase [Cyclonatronum proteinivorum]AXJ01358.1 phosphoribosylamine--glycine ligase [Cyclonatronum proteinivorum]
MADSNPGKINVLLIGSGGREHALAWALRKSDRTGQLFIAPGNPGTARCGTNVPLDTSNQEAVLAFIEDHQIGLTVVGPEQPLVEGIADFLSANGKLVFGPSQAAARLEGSKSFAKDIMKKYGVPTGDYLVFEGHEADAARAHITQNNSWPMVLKADGLAAGKGVFIPQNLEEALWSLDALVTDDLYGKSGTRLVIEEYLTGEEVSVFAICDGKNARILMHAQDHKRIGDGDTGLNTGGMGAYAPTRLLDDAGLAAVQEKIVEPMLHGMAAEGAPYVGVLYCGLMITPDGPKVIEFNCRFGDPECQVIMPALQSDFTDLLLAACEGRLDTYVPDIDMQQWYTCLVLASGGYPGSYEKGKVITGIPTESEQVQVFHAGTKTDAEGRLVTNGGRVLNVVAKGETLQDSIRLAYDAASLISFEGLYKRTDIGAKGLAKF